ncbi:hypothetical protein K458DRAFT_489003 [Lentithecium fluviatile CBS 122367]|uniref:Uncharacterized protein n=1 Tax=Lentithecium fluviatile CBS 122367 TaxID=1168545 RepID=A0A6G1IVI9_9PLEO|nr:hypothetical protein K458DRAFT_489003 [Lentithecium fluviatile CBS 122367]
MKRLNVVFFADAAAVFTLSVLNSSHRKDRTISLLLMWLCTLILLLMVVTGAFGVTIEAAQARYNQRRQNRRTGMMREQLLDLNVPIINVEDLEDQPRAHTDGAYNIIGVALLKVPEGGGATSYKRAQARQQRAPVPSKYFLLQATTSNTHRSENFHKRNFNSPHSYPPPSRYRTVYSPNFPFLTDRFTNRSLSHPHLHSSPSYPSTKSG